MALSILIVDDSKIVRKVIGKALRVAHIPESTVFEAENGAVGLEVARSQPIDLILADINMPVMGGIEMIEQLRKDSKLASIPVIVVSTEGSQPRRAELQKLGVDYFIRKPFEPEQFEEAVLGGLQLDKA